MVFSSLQFLFWFLPFFFISYFLVDKKYKNFCLLIYSLCFYAYGCINTPFYFLLLVMSLVINYYLAIFMMKYNKYKKAIFILDLVFNFSILFVFKYMDFFIDILNGLLIYMNLDPMINHVNLILPIGISFYTFQIVSYIIDVYRGTVELENNFIDLATYIIMFPQLIAGPIVRFNTINKELKNRDVKLEKVYDGIKFFVFGLASKVIISNRLSGVAASISSIGYESISTPLAWFGMISYSLQLYFDFFGYSLMAIGIGKIIGFNLPKNFDYPFISTSITEFWRRWHITLSTWFKEYVYIPLGGNKKGSIETVCNLFTVWFLTGIWHGANINFVLWGVFLALSIIFEKLFLHKIFEKYNIVGRIWTLLLIPISFLTFAVNDFNELTTYINRLFNIGGTSINDLDIINVSRNFILIFIVAIIFCTELPKKLYSYLDLTKYKLYIEVLILSILFIYSVYSIYMGLNDPFMYFRF